MMKNDNNIDNFVSQVESNGVDKRTSRLVLAGISLVSFGMLAYEVTMTRVLSVILSYHYVFAVISLALLGLGFGAIFSRLFHRRLARLGELGSLALLVGLLALSLPFSVLAIARISNTEALANITPLYFLIIGIPFFWSGIIFAELFSTFPNLSSRLYGMDLLGAASGAVGAIIAINILGGIKAIVVVSLFVLIAGLLYFRGAIGKHIKRSLVLTISLLMIFGLLGTGLLNSRLTDIAVASQDKEMYNLLSDPQSAARIIESRWNAFGRTDLVVLTNDPTRMVIFIDGTAGSSMYQFNGDVNHPDIAIQSLQTEFPGYIALADIPENEKNAALIIGPGGGRDVLLAQMAGIKQITAVEVNQSTVDMVRKYSQYNGGIYNAENVSVVVDEGRNFLKRQNGKYDIIMLSIPTTKTSRSLEGYALTENFLFTTDSIKDYLDHLSDNGRLVVVAHDSVETVKLLSLSLTALNQKGIDNESAMRQVAIIGYHHFPAFVLKKTYFEPSETVPLHRSIHEIGYDPALSYLPAIQLVNNISHTRETNYDKCANFDNLLVAAGQGKVSFSELSAFAAENGIDIRPVTDNSPFFYKFETGIPQPVPLVFWLSTITLVIVSWLFFTRSRNSLPLDRVSEIRSHPAVKTVRFIIFFAMLGIGFMLVEISIFQRLILFLGQPVLSLAVMLASILVAAGIGSLYSGRFPAAKITKVIITISPLIVVTLLLYAFTLPTVLNLLLGLDLILRLLATVLMLLPLGFLMGFPFPLGMRLLKEMKLEDSIPWVWGINGIGSVVGSALTIVVAITFGFTAALLLGAACYLVVFIMFLKRRPVEIPGDTGFDLTLQEQVNRASRETRFRV